MEGPKITSLDESLTLNYVDGYLCRIKDGAERLTTTIKFVCDLEAFVSLKIIIIYFLIKKKTFLRIIPPMTHPA